MTSERATTVIADGATVTTVAQAEPLPVPMPSRGGSCPHCYSHSGGFCVLRAGAQDGPNCRLIVDLRYLALSRANL